MVMKLSYANSGSVSNRAVSNPDAFHDALLGWFHHVPDVLLRANGDNALPDTE